jgi:hypothetical protein
VQLSLENDMTPDLGAFVDANVRTDEGIGTDAYVRGKFSSAVDDGSGMNERSHIVWIVGAHH